MKHVRVMKVQAGDLGCYDGPPIGMTQADERAKSRAIRGSRLLRDAILRAGLAA